MTGKHTSLVDTFKMQWFLHSEQHAVYSHTMGGPKIESDPRYPKGSPTYVLYAKKKVPPGAIVDHIAPQRPHRMRQVLYWTWREYWHGWRSQWAKPLECGCTQWRGKRYLYCSAEHFIESLR